MKIIHCADLHLDSKMTANLDKEKAKERKAQLLKTFERMISFAVENEVKAIADVKMGDFEATAWGCDLTHGYIDINADYRSYLWIKNYKNI